MNSKPKLVRSVLIVSITLIFLVSIAGFYLGYTWLQNEANKTNQVIIKTSISKLSDQSLNKLKNELDSLNPVITKIDALSAPSNDFQKVAIADITRYASLSNIGKVNFDFNSSTASNNSTKQFSINLAETVSYTSFVQFLELINNNIPKMKVDSFTISAAPDYNKDKAIIKDLKISMYVR